MRKYLYLIKKKKIKSWLKFWLLTNNKFNSILSNIIEGTSFNLQNTLQRYFKIFNIFGNSVQDGTPSPDNPVPIESVADDVNLFDINNYTITDGVLGFDISNLEIGKQYTFSSKEPLQSIKISDSPNGYGSVENYNYKGFTNFTFTMARNPNIPSSNTQYFFIALTGYNFITDINDVINYNIKVQKGTTPTTYSPYNYGKFTIDFEGQNENYNYTFITKPLRSLPNGVRDSLEDDGIHRRVGRVVLDGSEDENWNQYNNGFQYNYYLSVSNCKPGLQCSICTHFQNINYSWETSIGQVGRYSDHPTNTNKYFDTDKTTLASWQEWLQQNPIEVLFELAKEVIEPYTEEQQAEYDKIKELYTFDGTTNIYSDDEVPPYLQIQYYMKGE